MKLLFSLSAFALAFMLSSIGFGQTSVPQYVYSMDWKVPTTFDEDTGKPIATAPPTSREEVMRGAGRVESVKYYRGDNTQLLIMVRRGKSFVWSAFYLAFKDHDSARILKDALLSGDESLVLMIDYYTSGVKVRGSFLDVQPSAAFVWEEGKQTFSQIGNLIGPRRSLEEQGIIARMMIRIFGRAYLNKVD